ncbi:MAG: HAMP domain-containing protein, partial [Acidobacteria bacterium]|nr:HAMP domain-containing protein [Acidobacteriota bacterium]
MKVHNSAKFRLTLWYVSILALILTVFAGAVYIFFDSVLTAQTDSTLKEIASSFETTVNHDLEDEKLADPSARVDDEVNDAAVEVGYKNFKIFVFTSDKKLFSESKATDSDSNIASKTALKWLNGIVQDSAAVVQTVSSGGENYRAYLSPIEIRNKGFYLLIVHPLEATESTLEKVRFAFLFILPVALLLASVGGYLIARKSFEPIENMTAKAEEITARNLHQRLPIENGEDELGRLAKTFNRLLSRLDLSFEQQQRFMEDASHELRTPVSIVRGEAEVSLTKDDRESSEYRETIEIMQKEAERMSRIIEDLFTLARADAGENSVSVTSIYLEDDLSDTVRAFRSLASKRSISVGLDVDREMPMTADSQLIKRLFANLLDNAIRYAKDSVSIVAYQKNGSYFVEICDDGPGIPDKDQAHIFDRFYR